MLNCLRVLQRVLPVVFEIDGETTRFETEVLWKREEVEDDDISENPPREEESQFVIEDDDEDEDEEQAETNKPQPSEPLKPKEKKTLPSLAERLFSCLTDLLFCCGFTLPTKIQVDHYKINYVIWCVPVSSSARILILPQGEGGWVHDRSWA